MVAEDGVKFNSRTFAYVGNSRAVAALLRDIDGPTAAILVLQRWSRKMPCEEALQILNWADHYRLDASYGILPHDVARLPDIFTAPFLHYSWDHIEGNSGPLFVFGLLAAYRGVVRFLGVTVLVAVTSGLAVWLFQGSQTLTVGASGLIFGYFGYVLARGVIDRNLIDALAAVVMALSYAYILTVAIPGTPGVSWIGYLGGLIGGLAAGWIFRARRGARGPGQTGRSGDSGRGSPGSTVAVPVSPGHPRADLH